MELESNGNRLNIEGSRCKRGIGYTPANPALNFNVKPEA